MESSRTQKSIKNVSYALIGQFIALIVNFLLRMIFVKSLGEEFLGIDSLFVSIVSMLSLAELGVGSAINYSLYKPISERNTEKIKALMHFYKKIYRVIGLTIFLLGLLITPVVINLASSKISGVGIYFLLFVVNASVSYFYSYKKTLIIADQYRHITIVYRYSFYVIMILVQCLILFWLKNYYLYLIVMIVFTFLENYFMSVKADKLYPFLKEKNIDLVDKETKQEIKKNTYAMSFHKIGGVVVNSTDNIVISSFLGLTTVGLYSNYLLITNSLNLIFGQIFSSIIAGVGNLGVEESKQKIENTFETIFFYSFFIVSFSTIMLFVLINPFITIWLGNSLILSDTIVIFICLNFFIVQIRRAVLTFRDALGLYWFDRYKPLVESLLNILLSVFLVQKFGLVGVLIGTIISMLLTSVWVEPYILYKHGFNKLPFRYFIKLITYLISTIFIGMVLEYLKVLLLNFNFQNLFIEFIILCIVSIVSYFLLFTILFFNNKHFKSILSKGKEMIKKVVR